MDWNAAVEKNREALKRVIAMLAAMAGLDLRGQFTFFRQRGRSGEEVALAEKSKPSQAPTLPRRLHRAVLKLLRPAEAAVRRLLIVAARGLVVVLPPPRRRKPSVPRRPGRAGLAKSPQNHAHRVPQLPLLDPLRPWNIRARRTAGVPRISIPGLSELFRIPPRSTDDPVDATRLALRLHALARALDDLPGQAQRFARWRARGAGAVGAQDALGRRRFRRVWPLKPGRPPGWRLKPFHEVLEVLDVVHGLAFWALESPDTS